jgi:2,3-bisphosphoglycerate-dependent phosphoglycerate mutase
MTEVLSKEFPGSGFRVEEFAALAERSLGAAANLTLSEIEEAVRADPRYAELPEGWKGLSELRLPFLGAESLLESGERAAGHVEARMREIAGDLERDTLKLFVAHGGSLRHAAVKLGLLRLEAAPGLSMYHCAPIYFERGSDGRWAHVLGEWKQRR